MRALQFRPRSQIWRSVLVAAIVCGIVGAFVASRVGATPQSRDLPKAAGQQYNVIFILTDDLDKSLMPYLPNVRKLIGRQGASFSNYYVEAATCCTSRSTIMTGEYSHNTKVVANAYPKGGYKKFHETSESTALPTWLGASYVASFQGKFLNEYPYPQGYSPTGGEPSRAELQRYVPQGWDSWAVPVAGPAYSQTDYQLNLDGEVQPARHSTFLDKVLGERLLTAISANGGADFRDGGNFYEWASYAPHFPYAYPAKYESKFKNIVYPKKPSFNEADVSDKFGEAATRKRLSPHDISVINEVFRKRIRSLQVLDGYVAKLVAELRQVGALENTYLVFSSDNGYNMGEHRLPIFKYNHFEEASNVPLMVRGPGIQPGQKIKTLAGNIDLAPTFAEMTATAIPDGVNVDGLSLLGVLQGRDRGVHRKYLLLTRGVTPLGTSTRTGVLEPAERYVPNHLHARTSDFFGIVSTKWKLVRFWRARGQPEELYNLRRDPYELNSLLPDGARSFRNLPTATQQVVRQLRSSLTRLRACAGPSCTIDPASRGLVAQKE